MRTSAVLSGRTSPSLGAAVLLFGLSACGGEEPPQTCTEDRQCESNFCLGRTCAESCVTDDDCDAPEVCSEVLPRQFHCVARCPSPEADRLPGSLACVEGRPTTCWTAGEAYCAECGCPGATFCMGTPPSCVATLADGEPCTSGEMCSSGFCRPLDSTCGAPAMVGDTCDGHADCASGNCSEPDPGILGECLLAMETECEDGVSACVCEVADATTGTGYCLQRCRSGNRGCPRESDECYYHPTTDIPYCRRNCTDQTPVIGETSPAPAQCHEGFECVDMATFGDAHPESDARYICFLPS